MGPVHILWCIWYAFLTGGSATGHSDLVRRFQPANPIFGQIYEKRISGQANGKLITEMGLRGKIFISRFLSL